MPKRILRISDTLLLEILREGHEMHYRIEKGLPDDVKIVDFKMSGHWTVGRGEAELLLESQKWDPSPDNEPFLHVETRIQSLYPKPDEFLTFDEAIGYPASQADETASPP